MAMQCTNSIFRLWSNGKCAIVILSLALTSETGATQELARINVSIVPVIDAAPLIAASKLGYFKAEGIEIVIKPTVGGVQGLSALGSGAC